MGAEKLSVDICLGGRGDASRGIHVIRSGHRPGRPGVHYLKGVENAGEVLRGGRLAQRLTKMPIEGKEVVTLSYSNQEAQLRRLAELSQEVDGVLWRTATPPSLSGELLQRVRQLTHFEVVSGVSSVNIALAKAGLDLAQVVVVSQHARTPQQLPNCGRGLVIIPRPRWNRSKTSSKASSLGDAEAG